MTPIPVLLVTYNRMAYSKQALESILRNPGLPIEVTVFDNGSTDGTASWLEHLEEHTELPVTHGFNVAYSKTNLGLAPAMNYFFRKHADAPYVVKVDNDTVLPDNWLADLMEVMEATQETHPNLFKLGAVSGTCVRPPGLTAAAWYGAMQNVPFSKHRLYFNPACLGTGVLINMQMIRERGLLFEKFPRAPGAGPDDPCLISGWGAYIQEATVYSDWRFAMYSKVPVRLLNLKEDQVLSNDYPEYDAEVKKIRDDGNAWWESVGGVEGVRQYVQDHGGLEKLPTTHWHGKPPFFVMEPAKPWPWPVKVEDESCLPRLDRPLQGPIYYAKDTPSGVHVSDIGTWPAVWTEASDLKARSTFEFWDARVKQHGTTASTFLTTPQVRINEFTEQHMAILQNYARNKDILEVGCGWGRMSLPLSRLAKSFVGTDFVPELIDKARESMPDLDFQVAAATALPFDGEQFDLVVAIACLSSFAAILNDVTAELKRVLRPNGYILFLEEDYARVDWKLRNQ